MKKSKIAIIFICIVFILAHSLIPESKSARESLWFMNHIFNPMLSKIGIIIDKNSVRKIAHAVEFCVLSLPLSVWFRNPMKTFYAGFTVAFLDESLQVITKRGALVTDIWIDLSGVVIGVLIGSLIVMKHFRKTE